MVNKTLALLVAVLILIISIMTVLNIDQETDIDAVVKGDNTVTNDDIIDEISATLLDENGEIDIGDML
ncbi:hypothetical protein AYK24_00890 [Thermoplasmatales archaeon SG8-52-4]|nr:MAG: hypothetical protein AYK24_00890 [Thermoplasmatales archaeon SG8-52-4]